MGRIKDWIWNALFLDFYLDKRWTLKFKVLNFISGDVLREYLSAIHSQLVNCEKYSEEFENPKAALFYAKRAKRWSDAIWEYCRK